MHKNILDSRVKCSDAKFRYKQGERRARGLRPRQSVHHLWPQGKSSLSLQSSLARIIQNCKQEANNNFGSGPTATLLKRYSNPQHSPPEYTVRITLQWLTIGGNSIGLSRLWVRGVGCGLLHSCGKLCLPICSHSLWGRGRENMWVWSASCQEWQKIESPCIRWKHARSKWTTTSQIPAKESILQSNSPLALTKHFRVRQCYQVVIKIHLHIYVFN